MVNHHYRYFWKFLRIVFSDVLPGGNDSWWPRGRFSRWLALMLASHSRTGRNLNQTSPQGCFSQCCITAHGVVCQNPCDALPFPKFTKYLEYCFPSGTCGGTVGFATSVCLSWRSPGSIETSLSFKSVQTNGRVFEWTNNSKRYILELSLMEYRLNVEISESEVKNCSYV